MLVTRCKDMELVTRYGELRDAKLVAVITRCGVSYERALLVFTTAERSVRCDIGPQQCLTATAHAHMHTYITYTWQ